LLVYDVEGFGLCHLGSGTGKLYAHQVSFLKSKSPILVKILSNLPGDLFPPEAVAALQPETAHILPVQVPPQTDGHNCSMHVLLNALSLIEHLADGGEDVELPSWVLPILNTAICDEQRSAYGKQLFEHPFRA
jgi:hypothetical protein